MPLPSIVTLDIGLILILASFTNEMRMIISSQITSQSL